MNNAAYIAVLNYRSQAFYLKQYCCIHFTDMETEEQ